MKSYYLINLFTFSSFWILSFAQLDLDFLLNTLLGQNGIVLPGSKLDYYTKR